MHCWILRCHRRHRLLLYVPVRSPVNPLRVVLNKCCFLVVSVCRLPQGFLQWCPSKYLHNMPDEQRQHRCGVHMHVSGWICQQRHDRCQPGLHRYVLRTAPAIRLKERLLKSMIRAESRA